MLPFSWAATAGSPGAAMLPYCFVPAAAATAAPAGACAGNSTLARSSSVIFSVGLSSVLAIVSFFCGSFRLWRSRLGLRQPWLWSLYWRRGFALRSVQHIWLQKHSTRFHGMFQYLLVAAYYRIHLPRQPFMADDKTQNNGGNV